MDLKGRNFLTLKDFTPEEITYLLDLSAELKEKKKKGEEKNDENYRFLLNNKLHNCFNNFIHC